MKTWSPCKIWFPGSLNQNISQKCGIWDKGIPIITALYTTHDNTNNLTYKSNISFGTFLPHSDPTWEFQLCFELCNLANWTKVAWFLTWSHANQKFNFWCFLLFLVKLNSNMCKGIFVNSPIIFYCVRFWQSKCTNGTILQNCVNWI